MTTPNQLYYIHDPMCSWCWGFVDCWQRLQALLPSAIEVRYLLGGLAPDNEDPMPADMRDALQATWRRIESHIPGVRFNYDFWTRCQPQRATYPACRAVIAAREQDPAQEKPMIRAIQQAYYQQARNPSNTDTLLDCARELGLDAQHFTERLQCPDTQQQLMHEIQQADMLGARGYPSLVLMLDGETTLIDLDYVQPEPMLAQINRRLAERG